MHLHDLTIKKFHEGLVKKDFKALEATEGYFKVIEEKDKDIGAYLTLLKDLAYKEAEEVDLKIARGESVGVLAGVPLAIKDNILISGERATAGSKILENYIASYDATVIEKLKKAGAVFLGKANLDEFAMGASTENSGFHPTKNPHDLTRVPGGSSGGSVAAVAAHMALGGLGSETGGSIRQPSGFCGVVGLKTTYGAVSRHGVMAMASSLDQIGPIARTVEDTALLFDAIKGVDPYDSTSVDAPYGDDVTTPDVKHLKSLTIGIPEEYFIDGIEPEVSRAIEQAIASLKSLGINFKKISLPHTKYALSTYYIIVPAEVSSNMARYDGIRYGSRHGDAKNLSDIYVKTKSHGFGAEVKRRILLGTFVLSSGYYDAYYAKAQKVRALVKRDFTEAFKDVDVILTPVSPTRAFKLGERANDPLAMYLADIFTIPVNLAGLPGISIPVKGISGLPIGFQLIGKPFREADILGLGQLYEGV